jgi:hypothetical protein
MVLVVETNHDIMDRRKMNQDIVVEVKVDKLVEIWDP